MRVVKIISVKEAVEKLKAAGATQINEHRIRAGIEQGIYPFGVAVRMDRMVIEIYDVLLDRWIEERSREDESA